MSHHGAVRARQRKTRRVARPPSIGVNRKLQVQCSRATPRRRHESGKCVQDSRSRWSASATSRTTNPHSVSGAPSGTKSPTLSAWRSSRIRSALGRLAGKSRASTQRGVYQPPRCQPTWTSHGQTCSGGACSVAACVATTCGSRTSPSPGMASRRSAALEPAVRPSHCIAARHAAIEASTTTVHARREDMSRVCAPTLPIGGPMVLPDASTTPTCTRWRMDPCRSQCPTRRRCPLVIRRDRVRWDSAFPTTAAGHQERTDRRRTRGDR